MSKKKNKSNKKELQQKLDATKGKLEKTELKPGEKLASLIEKDMKKMKRHDKTRTAEILSIFAKYNFYANGLSPEDLRLTLEDMGPTYVKIGQIMSSRVDMLPQEYCDELGKLRANVKPLEAEVARAVIEQETGKKINEIYSEFRDEPLGSASVGQAHYAVLKDGTKVVTKVQRPLIAETMRKDFVLLKKLAALLNVVGDAEDNDEAIDLMSVIEELEAVTEEELDFRIEAENTKFFKENCVEDETKVTCPTVIDELTTERIFTMTYVDGYSVGKKDKIIADGYDVNAIGQAILENYIHQVIDVGTFHADPHQGNIMIAGGIPYWIDFGMIGHMTEGDINQLQALILSLLSKDVEAAVNAMMGLGATSPKTVRSKLVEDVDVLCEKYMSVTNLADIDMSVLLDEVTELMSRHYISLPGKYTMLVRSISTIEGVIEELCPELGLFEIISEKLMERAKQSFDLEQEIMSLGQGVLDVGKKAARLPALAADTLGSLAKGKMKINMELTGYDDLIKGFSETVYDVVLAVFACVIFFGSCILCLTDIKPQTPSGIPVIATVGFVFSVALGLFTVKQMLKKK